MRRNAFLLYGTLNYRHLIVGANLEFEITPISVDDFYFTPSG